MPRLQNPPIRDKQRCFEGMKIYHFNYICDGVLTPDFFNKQLQLGREFCSRYYRVLTAVLRIKYLSLEAASKAAFSMFTSFEFLSVDGNLEPFLFITQI